MFAGADLRSVPSRSFPFMSRKYNIHDQTDAHFLSYAVMGWVDALSRPAYKDIVVESLAYCQREKGLELFAWCIMSNHVHLIARAAEGKQLQDIMRDHKKFTAGKIVEAIEANLQESRRDWMMPLLRQLDGTIRFWAPAPKPATAPEHSRIFIPSGYAHRV